tara:strand:- start:2521 stop:3060 length:540 start_codon:yes stop_codon:yes gene_type:complete
MLKKIIFKRDKYLFVDCEYLKDSYENGRLKGAQVFARIFDIIEDDLFVSQNKDEYDLTHYDIYIEDWILFYSFIRNGYIPNSYNIDKNVEDLNFCYDLCIKFGGVPEYEKYYESFFYDSKNSQNDLSNNVYNPMTPIEDTQGKYTWRIVTSFTAINPTESVTSCVSAEPVTIFYCRKPI